MKKSKLFITTLLLAGVILTACGETENANSDQENEVAAEIQDGENKDDAVISEADNLASNDNIVTTRKESFELPQKLSFTDKGEIKMRIFEDFDDMWDEIEDERSAYTADFSSLDGIVLFDEQSIKGTFKETNGGLYLTVENGTDKWVDVIFDKCYSNDLWVEDSLYDSPQGRLGVAPGESYDLDYREIIYYPREFNMGKLYNWEGIFSVYDSDAYEYYIKDREAFIGENVSLQYECDDRLKFSAGSIDIIVLNQRTYPTGDGTPSPEVSLLVVNNNEKDDENGDAYVRLKSITVNGVEYTDTEALNEEWDEYWYIKAGRSRQRELDIFFGDIATVNDYESIEIIFEIEAEDEYGDEVYYYTNPIRFVNEK